MVSHMEARLAAGTDDVPYFAVGFRNGTVRGVYPSEDNPLEYRQQVVANEGGVRLMSNEADRVGLEFFNLQMQVAV